MDTSSPEAQVAPDNWEDHSVEINADGDDDMAKSFSKLNVDAPPFVPSFATLQMAQLDPPEKGNEDSPSGNDSHHIVVPSPQKRLGWSDLVRSPHGLAGSGGLLRVVANASTHRQLVQIGRVTPVIEAVLQRARPSDETAIGLRRWPDHQISKPEIWCH
ncbi:hypothetical protein HPB48_016843 [Haemaphysalis longicornis]|uniref:Uncharacterized protein n=1 Tax=Haemaphysalis longicornis TaxID=44386 RepID=A0A9J6FSL9_HAELO|nr:hypothetical protein HPB48_016843 [Haemaphysalis longicornis]